MCKVFEVWVSSVIWYRRNVPTWLQVILSFTMLGLLVSMFNVYTLALCCSFILWNLVSDILESR
jgi:hypothetical protein